MRAIVVGGGITGIAAAEWLRRDGHAVSVIDRVEPGDPNQTSFGNAGILASAAVIPVATPSLPKKLPRMLMDPEAPLFLRWRYLPRFIPWGLEFLRNGRADRVDAIAAALAPIVGDAVDQHRALARGTPAEAFITDGPYVLLYRDRATFEKDAWGWGLRRRHGFGWDEWDRAEIEARDPAIAPGLDFAAALRNHGWIASPAGYVRALADHFRANGGEIVAAEVAAIHPREGGRAAVTLDGGREIEADRVILAAGVWARKLAERLGHRVPMEAERGYHVMLRGPSHRPPFPIMLEAAKTVATPMSDGLRFAGVAEFAGIDAPPGEAPIALIRRQILKLFPSLTWEGEDVWMGRRPTTADSLPLLGAAPEAPGIVFAFGGQHLGLTMGPRLGRMAAAVAAGRPQNLDLAPYRVDRFGRA